MTVVAPPAEPVHVDTVAAEAERTPRGSADLLTAGAAASIGAGVIHAAAASAHSEHDQAVAAFVALAVLQVACGAVALVRRNRSVAGLIAVISTAAVGGWVMAKTTGIPFVEGLDERESIQTADAVAAALAGVAALAGLAYAVGANRSAVRVRAPIAAAIAAAFGLVSIPGVVDVSTHRHEGTTVDADGHAHASDTPDTASVVPPTPYDPTKPIDLGGVEGVTPEQQAKAENLIAVTLARLPRFADPAVAEASGFRSIGDGLTGFEHFVNRNWIDDGKILDPDYPESLVYRVANGQRTLEAAMFMLPSGTTLEQVPTDIGGRLVQWHIHDNLCFTPDPETPRVAGLTLPDGTCRAPLVAGTRVPMVHVWIVPHPCGPFAALEGIGAGQIKQGETRLCDHAHGAPA